jgi:hypothetical protein
MKRKQQILYGLLALVIMFIIWKFMFNNTDNFSVSASWNSWLCPAEREQPCEHINNWFCCNFKERCQWNPAAKTLGVWMRDDGRTFAGGAGGYCSPNYDYEQPDTPHG